MIFPTFKKAELYNVNTFLISDNMHINKCKQQIEVS